ncbi:TAXI family TRAP transporter solute-binding subunit [Aurantimonas sp. DM33-3]|uniref:TAXI family TRAP transporter solute-binding subunit n=1 Tax=Aurantimonas sp. DM33-3 TaxID=2766955 RepID=UPI001651FD12|nr:TAXI family TRAP transporter solute-binding subunit [Aurantimonas sp. DM33-3]MBC6717740.1 TAXI family TRAP transporter solute-binding subunit [Aurantimonas sp. DM33-3]
MGHKQVALGLALSVMAMPIAGQAQERWSIATSSTGSGPYIIGSAIAEAMNKGQSGIEVSAQSSGGYNDNLSLVAQGNVNSGLTLLSELGDAWRGTGKFEAVPDAKERFEPLRRMFPVTTATFQCVVRADSGITKFSELKGKRLNINVPATATQAINRAMIAALGMKPEDFNILEIATSGSYDALSNNVADATCNGQPMPSGSIQQLAASTPVRVLDIPDDAFDKLNESYQGTMLKATIPAGTYSGQDDEVHTFAYPEVLFVNKDAEEEQVYELTKAYWEGERPTNPAFAQVTIKNATVDVAPPIHPGALRYLKEKDLMK